MSRNGHLDPDSAEDEDEWDGTEIIRAKWAMDGAKTLTEAAAQLRRFAEYLDELRRDGWELAAPVEDDYGLIENVDRSKRLSVRLS